LLFKIKNLLNVFLADRT